MQLPQADNSRWNENRFVFKHITARHRRLNNRKGAVTEFVLLLTIQIKIYLFE